MIMAQGAIMDDYRERYDEIRKSLKELVNDYLLRSIILDYDGRYAGSAINFIKDLYGDILAMFHERFRLIAVPSFWHEICNVIYSLLFFNIIITILITLLGGLVILLIIHIF